MPAEGSQVGVAESRVARRGSENNDVRMLVESDFTKIFMFISNRTVIIVFLARDFGKS